MTVAPKVLRFRLMKVVLAWAFLGSLQMMSQANYVTQLGPPAAGATVPVELGEINLTNGNLHQEIPLGEFPQRGKLGYSAKLVYDSRIWQYISPTFRPSDWLSDYAAPTIGGWRL